MATAATLELTTTSAQSLTVAELAARFGDLPARRIVTDPAPGTATLADMVELHDRQDRLCELIDGVLVEKDMSWEASTIAMRIGFLIQLLLRESGLGGSVTGEQGAVRLPAGNARIPDVAYVSRARTPLAPIAPIPDLVPNLAVEVLSPGNTRQEMADKLAEYFASGVELVWYVDPPTRSVRVFTSVENVTTLTAGDTLDGGSVLPGFAVQVAELFAQD